MDKQERDELRQELDAHPGQLVPALSTELVKEFLDQIDRYEESIIEMEGAMRRVSESSVNLCNALYPYIP